MGAEGSKTADVEQLSAHDFVNQVHEVCKNDSVEDFKKLWAPFVNGTVRREDAYDKGLLADNIMDNIKTAFRSQKLEWRREGILVARTFFHIDEARRKLVKNDFVGSVLLITLPEDAKGAEDEQELSV